MAQAVAYYDGNSHNLEIRNLTNTATDLPQTTGTGTADIWDNNAGAIVTNSDIVLTHIASGLWRGAMPATVVLSDTGSYKLRVTITDGALVGYWEPVIKSVTREQ